MDQLDNKIDNQQKYENYAEQFRRLNKALANGFNLEAMFIAYALMEDRTESVLRHAGLWDAYMKSRKGREPTINSKVKYICNCAKSGNEFLKNYFADDLLDQILVWKDERNRLIHALLNQQFAHHEISALAQRGNELCRVLRSRVTNCNRAADRKRAAEEKSKCPE